MNGFVQNFWIKCKIYRLIFLYRDHNWWYEILIRTNWKFYDMFSSNNFLSSILTFSCRLIGIRRLFWCLGWKSLWNLYFATWFFDLPVRDINSGKVFAICSLNSGDEMLLTRLLFWDVDWVTASPSWSNKSPPIRDFSLSATTVNVAVSQMMFMKRIWLDEGLWKEFGWNYEKN